MATWLSRERRDSAHNALGKAAFILRERLHSEAMENTEWQPFSPIVRFGIFHDVSRSAENNREKP